jgi:soluble lytic murein transglycosylase-like protein
MNSKTRQSLLWIIAAITAGVAYMNRQTIAETAQEAYETLTGSWLTSDRAKPYVPLLNAAESKYGIPRNLLARIAYQESRWRDDIVFGKLKSSTGAVGIMQLMPKYHPTVNPLDIPAAIDYAGKFLVGLYKQFGSWKLAVAAYNAGAGNVTKYKGVPPFAETQKYVTQVFADLTNDKNRRYYA